MPTKRVSGDFNRKFNFYLSKGYTINRDGKVYDKWGEIIDTIDWHEREYSDPVSFQTGQLAL